jgi:hypothetical protein
MSSFGHSVLFRQYSANTLVCNICYVYAGARGGLRQTCDETVTPSFRSPFRSNILRCYVSPIRQDLEAFAEVLFAIPSLYFAPRMPILILGKEPDMDLESLRVLRLP